MAANTIDFKADGIQQAMAALNQFGKSEVKKMFRKVTRAVAKDQLQEAKRRTPVETGDLEASLAVRAAKLSRRKRPNDVGAQVTTREGMFQGEQFYGGFQEFGWWQGGKFHGGERFLRGTLYDMRNHWYGKSKILTKQMLPQAVKDAKKRAMVKAMNKARAA